MKRLSVLLVAVGLIIVPPAASAQSATPAVQVEQPWARASAGPARNGVAYLTLTNDGSAADRLVAGASPVAEHVEFHTHINDAGILRMRQVDAIDLAPGEPVVFKPGGLHVMLVGLHEPLKAGEHFPLTLSFEHGGDVTVEVTVETAGARGPSRDHGGHGS